MKKTSVILIMLLLACFTVQAQESSKGVTFVKGTIDEAFAASQKAGKPLFVDIWASWCGPCKRLGREIFPQEKVGEFFNEHFVCYQLQTDPKDPEALKKATEFKEKYYVQFLPTLVWIDTNGELMHYVTGFMEADALIAQAKAALDPNLRSAQFIKRWKEGDRSVETAMKYFTIFNQETEEFDHWYEKLSLEDRTNSELSTFMAFRFNLPVTSPTPALVASHWAEYKDLKEVGMWQSFLSKSYNKRLEAAKDSVAVVALNKEWSTYGLDFVGLSTALELVNRAYKEKRYAEARRQTAQMVEKHGVGAVYRLLLTLIRLRTKGEMTADQAPSQLEQWAAEYAEQAKNDPTSGPMIRLMSYCVLGKKTEAEEWLAKGKQAVKESPTMKAAADQFSEMLESFMGVFKK